MRTSDSFSQSQEMHARQQPRAIAIAATRPAQPSARFLLGVFIVAQCLALCVSHFLK